MSEPICLHTKGNKMICKNDVIEFLRWDSNNLIDREYKYLVLDYNTFIYLGNGIDVESVIGKVKNRNTIIDEMNDKNPIYKGFKIVSHVRTD